jgi:hypothetical protein
VPAIAAYALGLVVVLRRMRDRRGKSDPSVAGQLVSP